MKKLIVIFSAVVLGIGLSLFFRSYHFSTPIHRSGKIKWITSIPTSLKEAKKDGRPMVLDFYAAWCEYCQLMEKTSYQNSKVIQLSHDFVMTRINVDKHKNLTEYFGIQGLPTLVFASFKTGEIGRLEGYIPPNELAHVMSEVVQSGQNQKK
ncbi:MAG: thioredoxin family protein [Firmicutes bacterium]|nr:thioredoxin family protein [Bacillota bacterium]